MNTMKVKGTHVHAFYEKIQVGFYTVSCLLQKS